MKEIGSEYYYEKCVEISDEFWNGFTNVKDSALVFSGRTAIETILKNIPHAKKAILPSYCCSSMIDPFLKANIQVEFYKVSFDNKLVIDTSRIMDADVLLWCNYFGFQTLMPDFTNFIKKGGIIIEDITHSFLSEKPYHNQSHYLVASIRKWGAILCGGYCASLIGKIFHKPSVSPPETFLLTKRNAMNLKERYIFSNDYVDKQSFLALFSMSNNWLASNYSGLKIDNESEKRLKSIKWNEIREIRRSNARMLFLGLRECSYVRFIFDEKDMKCPLFVPIVVESKKRDVLRKKLIKNNIYCPVHWPKPSEQCISNLYDTELSLICDHRYDEEDMKKIVSIICNL